MFDVGNYCQSGFVMTTWSNSVFKERMAYNHHALLQAVQFSISSILFCEVVPFHKSQMVHLWCQLGMERGDLSAISTSFQN